MLLAVAALLGSAGSSVSSAAPGADGQKRLPQVPLGGGPDYAMVEPGSSAPDFAYETLAGGDARLRDLRDQGHVLLVFGANEAELRRLDLEYDRLARLGVVPVAVLDWRVGACRSVVRRLSLRYPVVPDPQRAIGAQYNALEARTRQNVRAWFVVDRAGRVRGLDRYELPRGSWADVAASALGLPADGVLRPAGSGAK